MNAPTPWSTADLELAYDALAEGIDRAGADKSELFLVKLALLMAQQAGDRQGFEQQIEVALRDM
jgi:hypothetical protein